MRSLKLSFNQIRTAIIICLVILNSGYALSLGYQSKIMLATFGFIFADLLLTRRKIVVKKSPVVFLLIVLIQFILAFAANFDVVGIKEYIRLTVVWGFCFYISISYSSREIIEAFCKFIFCVSMISVVFYGLVILFPQFGYKVINGYGTVYSTCFISFVNVSGGGRNCGPFWEPGVFAAICFLVGFLEIYIIRKLGQRKLRMVVLVISILTTHSTSGYIYLLVLGALFYLRDDSKKYSGRRVLFAIFCVLMGLFLFINYQAIVVKLVDINPLVFKKLLLNNTSVTDRTTGPLADIYVSLRYPFGSGVGDLTAIVEEVAQEVFGTVLHTRTSTITYYCAAFGMWSGIVVLGALVKFIKSGTKSVLFRTVAMLGVIIMSLSSPLHDSAIFITLLFIGIQENIIINKKVIKNEDNYAHFMVG